MCDGANALFSPSALPVPDEGRVLDVRSSARNGSGVDLPGVNKGKARPFTVIIKLVKELDTTLLQKAFSDSAVNVKPLVYALDTVAKAGIRAILSREIPCSTLLPAVACS